MSHERIISDPEYLEKIPDRIARLNGSKEKNVENRRLQLQTLLRVVLENRDEISDALQVDLGRDHHSSFMSELGPVEVEIVNAIKNLSSWTSPKSVSLSIANKAGGGSADLVPEPLGVVLIMSAWNYPVLTLLQPAVGAIAAGNAVVLKPASLAGNTSRVVANLIEKYFENKGVIVIEGGVESAKVVLKQRFDKIMYTGGSAVGKIVMEQASKHLTPVALELGGKNPLIVTQDAKKNLKVVARRIVWSKFALNVGQVCLSPDYMLVHTSLAESLIHAINQTINEFFDNDPKTCGNYSRIINEHHTNRLGDIIEGDKAWLVSGGDVDVSARYVAPTILDFKNNISAFKESRAMRDEIFGPILPITYFNDINECIDIINQQEKPLAAYLFGSISDGNLICENTSSGSLTVNDCVMQKVELGLPFGGVGLSGFGRYNGKFSFEAFSHFKPYLKKGFSQDLDARYPPYTDNKRKLFMQLHEVLIGSRSVVNFGYQFLKYSMLSPQ